MKKILSLILVIVLTFSLLLVGCDEGTDSNTDKNNGSAADRTDDTDKNASEGFLYRKNSDGSYSIDRIGSCTDTELVIPSKYNNRPVVYINDHAFWGQSKIISVTIPDSVTYIGEGAFADCKNLTSVTMGNGVNSIGIGAFSDCVNLTNITISNSIEKIDEHVFEGCKSLIDITIPNSVKNIEKYAFYNCENLSGVIFGNGVTSIGESAFEGCKNLVNITIPNDATNITISESAFAGCENLVYTIYENAKYLGNSSNPYHVLVKAVDNEIVVCTIHDETKIIVDNAFYDCDNITGVEIPENVTTVGNNAFYDCNNLSSVKIPKNVTFIGKTAFSSCRNLSSILVEEGNLNYKSVDGNLYNKDLSILIQYAVGSPNTSFSIPDGVIRIEDCAFYISGSLASVSIPDSVESVGKDAFSSCSKLPYKTKNKAEYIGSTENPYHILIDYYSYGNDSIQFHEDMKIIADYAFYMGDFKNIRIPEGVKGIGNYSFYGSRFLIGVRIPDSVTNIGDYAFGNCEKLGYATIGDNVTSIGDYAFYYCEELDTVSIGNSVKNIGNYAFYECVNLEKIKYNGSDSEWKSISFGVNWKPYTLRTVYDKNGHIITKPWQ